MKHIKLFEEYTDQDLEDLMSDLYSVGLAGKHKIKIYFESGNPDFEMKGTASGVSDDLRAAAEFALAAALNCLVNGNSDQSIRDLKVPDFITTKEQVQTVFDYVKDLVDLTQDDIEKEIANLMQGKIGPEFVGILDVEEASATKENVLKDPDGGTLEDVQYKELSLEDDDE